MNIWLVNIILGYFNGNVFKVKKQSCYKYGNFQCFEKNYTFEWPLPILD